MFPEAVHNKTMLPGGPLLARLAWRPQLQLRRVLVQGATLPAQRSESSDQRRGQGRRFAPLIGATGALLGAAVVSEEERKRRKTASFFPSIKAEEDSSCEFDHGPINVETAKLRLQASPGDPVGRYLVRKCNGDDVVSYITNKGNIAHVIVPQRQNSTLLTQNINLNTLQERVSCVAEKFGINLLYPVTNEDQEGNITIEDNEDVPGSAKKCHICEEPVEQQYHVQNHRIKSCDICFEIVSSNAFDNHRKSHNLPTYHCQQCEYKAKYRTHLVNHVARKHSGQCLPFKCTVCGIDLKTIEQLENHKNRAHGTRFLCSFCDKTFAYRKDKKKHEIRDHSGNEEGTEAGVDEEEAGAESLTVSGVESLGEEEAAPGGGPRPGQSLLRPHTAADTPPVPQLPPGAGAGDSNLNQRDERRRTRVTREHLCPHCQRPFHRQAAVKIHLDMDRCPSAPKVRPVMTPYQVYDFASGPYIQQRGREPVKVSDI